MRQRLKQFYQKRVIPDLYKQFHYKNIHQVPHIKKIVVNRRLGEIAQNAKTLEFLTSELAIVVAQRGVVTRARKAISRFKIREKIPVGITVTLRGERIYAFLDRLLNLALPRIRDFQGVKRKRFDGKGNYSIGFSDQLMFPEIRYDQVNQVCGMNISIITSHCTDKERWTLLTHLGIPFREHSPS